MSCDIDAVLVSELYCSRPGTYVWPHGTPRMLCAVHYREMCRIKTAAQDAIAETDAAFPRKRGSGPAEAEKKEGA